MRLESPAAKRRARDFLTLLALLACVLTGYVMSEQDRTINSQSMLLRVLSSDNSDLTAQHVERERQCRDRKGKPPAPSPAPEKKPAERQPEPPPPPETPTQPTRVQSFT